MDNTLNAAMLYTGASNPLFTESHAACNAEIQNDIKLK